MSYNYGDNNPFYNKCHDSVFNEIESRAKKYGSVERGGTNGKPIHEWLYGKTGYVLIKYLNGNDYNTRMSKLYTNGQLPVNNLFNPYSWSKLIQDWREGKLKRQ